MIQEILAASTVAGAALYLVFKLWIAPQLRAKGPDVPASRLVRRSGPKPRTPPSCH
ncbi:MAG: hypothetical protein HOV80_15275 [Polyangiaceae bacterium]|nr:hypothetical protein [Polyangiaceae bacterium]